jgi:hypothetical protein
MQETLSKLFFLRLEVATLRNELEAAEDLVAILEEEALIKLHGARDVDTGTCFAHVVNGSVQVTRRALPAFLALMTVSAWYADLQDGAICWFQ